jgi:ketosteroid isomerase-like protein
MFKVILVLVGILVMTGLASAATSTSSATVRAEVQAAVKAYVDAGNRADVSAMMEMVSRKEGVSSISDGEIERGWETIRKSNDEIVGKEGTYKISIGSIDVLVLSPSLAVAVTPFTFTLATEKGTVQAPGALSIVFEKSGKKWLVVHEHTSIKVQEVSTFQGD